VNEHLIENGEEEPVAVLLLGEHPPAIGGNQVELRQRNKRIADAMLIV
jgi:hypothetical protein